MLQLIRKSFVLFILWFSLVLVSCGNKQSNTVKGNVDINGNWESNNIKEWKINGEKLSYIIVWKKEIKEIKDIKQKKLDVKVIEESILLGSWYRAVWKIYKKILGRTEDNIISWKKIEDIIDITKWKNRKIKVSLIDSDTNKWIEWVKVYLWWWLLWITNKEWKLVKEIKIPEWYEYITLQADKKWYSPIYKTKDILYNNWRLVVFNLKVKKIWKIYDINPKKILVKNDKINIDIEWDCVLKDRTNHCYTWKTKLEVDYIKPAIRDQLSIPSKAIYSWQIVNLVSNWMAFIKFYDESNNRLFYNKDWARKVNICYKVWKQKIIERENSQKLRKEGTDGYWWFDKNKWVWYLDKNAKITVDKSNWLFCFDTKYVY